MDVAVSAADRLGAAALKGAGDFLAGDGVEPAAERAETGVVVEPARRLSHGQEDFLRQVRRVGVLQTVAAGETVHQAAIQFHELPPGVAVLRVAQAGEQAGGGLAGASAIKPTVPD